MKRNQQRERGKTYFHWLGSKCVHYCISQDRLVCCGDRGPQFQHLLSCWCCMSNRDQLWCSSESASPRDSGGAASVCDVASMQQKERSEQWWNHTTAVRSSAWKSHTSLSLAFLWVKQVLGLHLSWTGQGYITLLQDGRFMGGISGKDSWCFFWTITQSTTNSNKRSVIIWSPETKIRVLA